MLGDLPVALGVTLPATRKATVPIDPPIERAPHPMATTESTADAIVRSYKYAGEGDIDDEDIMPIGYISHAVGRPSDYTKKMPKIAFTFALLGLSDERISSAMGICIKTFYMWCETYPEFSQALIDGRENVDGLVVNAMFRRATGFKYKAVKIMPNKEDPSSPIYAQYEEYVPPDVTAGKYWLGIRRGKMRKDGWVDTEPENTMPPPVQININVSDPQEAARQYREIIQGEIAE